MNKLRKFLTSKKTAFVLCALLLAIIVVGGCVSAYFIATDAEISTFPVTFLDNTPPTITIDELPDLTNKSAYTITGTVADGVCGVDSVIVKVGNEEYTATVNGNTWTADVKLSEGDNDITAVATDKANNSASDDEDIVCDTIAPDIVLKTLADTVHTDTLTISGTVSDKTSGVASVTVTIGSTKYPVTVDSTGAWTLDVTLVEGDNTIVITATDKAGNVSTTSDSVAYTNYLTSIAVTTPPDDTSYYTDEEFDPTGMVVTAYYEDGSSRVLSEDEYTILNGTNLTESQTTITVSYTEKNITKTATTPITVIQKVLQAVYTAADNTLTFVYTEPLTAGTDTYNGQTVTAVYTGFETADYGSGTAVPWYAYRNSVKSVVFEDEVSPISTAYWFYGMSACTSMDLKNLKTDSVTDMDFMFYGCSALTSLDVTGFNTAKVRHFDYMFRDCSNLTSLDVSNFNTDSAVYMNYMFYNCSKLTTLDVSKFNTASCTNLRSMFNGCSGLTSLDVSGFATSTVLYFDNMFLNCSKLTTLDVSKWVTSSATTMSGMFNGCSGLTSLNVSGFTTNNVRNMENMFYNCSKLTTLDVSKWVTSSATTMSGMFNGCSGLTSLDVSNFDTSKVTEMGMMFYNCSKLTTLDVSGFNTAGVTTFTLMFSQCSSVTSLDVSGFETPNATTMKGMFAYCSQLSTLDVSKFNTSNVTDTSMMFLNCSNLTTIYASDLWSNASVTESSDMFTNCLKLVGGAGTAYSIDNADATYAIIDQGAATPGYFTDKSTVDDSASDAPDYVQTAAEDLATLVASHQNENTISFFAVSDTHYTSTFDYYKDQSMETLTHLGQAVEIVSNNVNVDFAAMLGDIFWDYDETQEEAVAATQAVYNALLPGFGGVQNFWAVGNHDILSSSDTNFTTSQIYANIGTYNAGATVDSSNPEGGYCYADFEEYKLRVILLNTTESASVTIGTEQLAWFEDVLDLSEKGDGWQSLILSHIPLDYWGDDTAVMQVVENASGIIANIHGHNHCYKVDYLGNTDIKRICIPNACFWRNNERNQESVTYDKTPDSAEDTAFCVVTIDFAEQKIYVDHYGAGYDRVVPYTDTDETFTITNNLTNVTSSNTVGTIALGGEYIATLAENDGCAMENVTVTMGGVDVTSNVYSGRTISILCVTGDVVVTATAVEESSDPTYTNLVPTSEAADSTDPYNGVGYKNGAYLSSGGTPWEGSDSTTVLTGFIPYTVPSSGAAPTIYIKGATWKEISHCRLYMFDSAKSTILRWITGSNNDIGVYFTVEVLGDDYYKLTPIVNSNGVSTLYKSGIAYFRISLYGTGNDLIITLDEPIEAE